MSGRSAVPALDSEDRLIEFAASCRHDPLRFVLAAYPWGERGGPLERQSWRCDAIAWDGHRPEALAGFHNSGRRIIYGFDESAAIADLIFRESEGILAGSEDTEIVWLVLGNPTRSNSMFRTLFAGWQACSLMEGMAH